MEWIIVHLKPYTAAISMMERDTRESLYDREINIKLKRKKTECNFVFFHSFYAFKKLELYFCSYLTANSWYCII